MRAAIQLHQLEKRFGPNRGVLGIDLCVEPGQVFGFLGPNGAGKSTTIRCLLGLYRPDGGRAEVLGQDPAGRDPAFLTRVGYLPGELHLPEALTGADVLARYGRLRGLADLSYRNQLIERFGVELDRPVKALSKGNKQKLGLVLAFAHRPELLVLDEPTSGLDPLLQEEFARLLRETEADGRTVLLSSHDLAEVQRVVRRVAIIKAGRIVIDDTVEALRDRAPRTIELTFDHDVDPARLQALPQVSLRSASPRAITLTHTGSAAPVLAALAPLAPDTITAQPADLEELFLQLYEEDRDAG